ncbi:solute carrier family 41 member 2 [Aphelenchoides avenae]|nr:solute carrier family 41 member 2 [Aphelenchus avenae]
MSAEPGFKNLVEAENADTYGSVAQAKAQTAKDDSTLNDGIELRVFPSNSASPQEHHAEPSLVLFFQVLFPFLIAGFGMVLAGIVLDIVQHWSLFREVPETFILVPALLGLKGNLEMTLASRLSTQASCKAID